MEIFLLTEIFFFLSDSLRPLTRPTAASAAKNRAVSPRSEDRRVRREELKRAKRLLVSGSLFID